MRTEEKPTRKIIDDESDFDIPPFLRERDIFDKIKTTLYTVSFIIK